MTARCVRFGRILVLMWDNFRNRSIFVSVSTNLTCKQEVVSLALNIRRLIYGPMIRPSPI